MISVIIPTLNEEAFILRSIQAVLDDDPTAEVIVTDGGSSDKTVTLSRSLPGVIVVGNAHGRGPQMRSGAAAAHGGVLLFLHADTLLEQGWSRSVLASLEDTGVAGGAFTLAVRGHGWRYRAIEQWVSLRSRLFRLPYGDQAIFIRKDVYDRIGGVKEIPLMEDVDLVTRMRREGRLAILGKKAVTSDRRWAGKGWARASLLNHCMMAMYKVGVSPATLARIYYGRSVER